MLLNPQVQVILASPTFQNDKALIQAMQPANRAGMIARCLDQYGKPPSLDNVIARKEYEDRRALFSFLYQIKIPDKDEELSSLSTASLLETQIHLAEQICVLFRLLPAQKQLLNDSSALSCHHSTMFSGSAEDVLSSPLLPDALQTGMGYNK